MKTVDWIKMAGVAIAVIGSITFGTLYIGELKGRVDVLQAQINEMAFAALKQAEKEAAERLMQLTNRPNLEGAEFEYWGHGGSEIEMIGTDEGFCYLTRVEGKFEGGGEAVWIHIRGASWYLGGQSGQDGVGARARCWRWPS